MAETPSDRDRWMAEKCAQCKVCNVAREKQRGFSFWFVKNIEDRFCPFCQAYERVYGRKAHEPVPAKAPAPPSPEST